MTGLFDKEFRGLFRMYHMVCFSFGQTLNSEEVRLGSRIIHCATTPEYHLTLTCTWRLRSHDRILLTSEDVCAPFSEDMLLDDNWSWLPEGRPREEGSIFDAAAPEVENAMLGSRVALCTVTPWGDLRLDFTNGCVLETFVDVTRKSELWHLHNNRTGADCILYDMGDA